MSIAASNSSVAKQKRTLHAEEKNNYIKLDNT